MFLIDKVTLEVVAEVSHEWVVEHKEMWFDGTLDEMDLVIVPLWGVSQLHTKAHTKHSC